ncbi:hypothetical protein CROQUDRAFT_16587, partial [Cronartium quercuum f. sp. fusiforme G11]
MIETSFHEDCEIAQLQAEALMPCLGNKDNMSKHTTDAKLVGIRPPIGKAHRLGHHFITQVIIEGQEVPLLLDTGASCSVVGRRYLAEKFPDWKKHMIDCSNMTFSGCATHLVPLGVIPKYTIIPHVSGNVRIFPEFVVMDNVKANYFILGAEFLNMYGINIYHSKEKYFTINDNMHKKFAI